MSGEWVLGSWTAVGVIWWVASLLLVLTARPRRVASHPPDPRKISVFKPLAALDDEEFAQIGGCLESFAAAITRSTA